MLSDAFVQHNLGETTGKIYWIWQVSNLPNQHTMSTIRHAHTGLMGTVMRMCNKLVVTDKDAKQASSIVWITAPTHAKAVSQQIANIFAQSPLGRMGCVLKIWVQCYRRSCIVMLLYCYSLNATYSTYKGIMTEQCHRTDFQRDASVTATINVSMNAHRSDTVYHYYYSIHWEDGSFHHQKTNAEGRNGTRSIFAAPLQISSLMSLSVAIKH